MSRRRKFSRREVMISAALVGAGYAGLRGKKLSDPPTVAKSLGRIADIDGIALELPKPANLPAHDPALPWLAKGGELNDASALSRTPVYGVVGVRNEADIAGALAFARDNGLKVSMAAVRHSMGGHAFDDHALVLDMRAFGAIRVNEAERTVTVQPGATWHDIQLALHPRLAVKSMQSSNIFSVGGSISVNAHGMDHRAGSIAGTIRSLRVMLADGSVVACSRGENGDLFRHVVGGYGLFAIILEATLDVTDNAVYRTERQVIAARDFPRVFASGIENDDKLGLFYGHLSTAPSTPMEEMVLYTYRTEPGADAAKIPPLGEPGAVRAKRLLLNLAKSGGMFAALKWWAEKSVEAKFESCTVPRTSAMGQGEACLVSRNDPMHDSVPYLFNDLPDDTDILHEYFVPRAAYGEFIPAAAKTLMEHGATTLNASLRIVHAEDTALTYAPAPAFSLVLYINQKTDAAGHARMRKLTRALIDLTLAHGGRFFLPYQLHYTRAQLLASYPELPAFLAKKDEYDPAGLFTSTWYRAVKALAAKA